MRTNKKESWRPGWLLSEAEPEAADTAAGRPVTASTAAATEKRAVTPAEATTAVLEASSERTVPFTCTYRFCSHATGEWWLSVFGVVGCQDCRPAEPDDPRLLRRGDRSNPPLVLVGRTTTPAVWPLDEAENAP
jgi:hypothetical protein